MTPERWQRISELFEAALERAPRERAVFLDHACEGDPELRAEVQKLLDSHDELEGKPWPPLPPIPDFGKLFRAGEVIGERYRILRFVGEGGMGEVYEVEDLVLNGRVALKAIRPEFAADERMAVRFKNEIQLARQVTHPNVCRTFDVARHGEGDRSVMFLTMEFLDGETLSQKLKRDGPIAPEEALLIARAMAAALDAAHRAGVIHRDFKSANVMLVSQTGGRRAVVTDFGLARASDPENRNSAVTGTVNLIGTPDYMAPELFAGEPATPASDIYAFGVVLHEMLTGRRSTGVAGISKPSVRWERATLRCLERDPARRFARASDAIGAIEGNVPRISVSKRWLWPAAAALLCVGAWLGVRQWRSGSAGVPPEASRWYRTGTEFLQAGASFAATRALTEAVRMDSHFSLAHARLAEAWNDLGVVEKAKEEMLLAQGPGSNVARLPEADRLYVEAVYSVITRHFKEAEGKYEEMLRRAGDLDKAVMYADLGRVYERDSQREKAMIAYRRAEEASPSIPAASLHMAVLYVIQQKPAEAEHSFKHAQDLYQAMSNQEGMTEVLLQRGIAANRANRAEKAGDFLKRALASAQVTRDEYQMVRAQQQMAVVSLKANDEAAAQNYAKAAIATARESGVEIMAVQGLVGLALALEARRQFDEAQATLNDALAIARRENSRLWQAISLTQLGDLDIRLKRSERGLPEARQALSIFREDRFATETGFCLALIGRAERDRGNLNEASAAFNELATLGEKSGDRSQIALAEESIGSLLMAQERFPEALRHYRKSLELNIALGDKGRIASASQQCGDVLWRMGRYREAGAMLADAEASAGDNRSRQIDIGLARAEAALSRLQYRDVIEQCHRIESGLGATDLARNAMQKALLCVARSSLGEKTDARKLCRECLQTASRVPDTFLLRRVALAVARARLESGDLPGALSAMKIGAVSTDLPESGWRSSLIAAQASEKIGAHSQALVQARTADAQWNRLESSWGAEVFATYAARPDIQQLRRHLLRLIYAFKNEGEKNG